MSDGWTVFGERDLYTSPWVRLGLIDVESPAGERYDHHVVELPAMALALVVDERERVLLLWKHRFVADRWGYELPGGMVDPGESARAAAARETREESGWRVRGEGEHVLTAEPLPGMIRTSAEVFRWRGADHEGPPSDPEEVDTVIEWVPVDRLPELVTAGRVLGSATGLALLHHCLRTPP